MPQIRFQSQKKLDKDDRQKAMMSTQDIYNRMNKKGTIEEDCNGHLRHYKDIVVGNEIEEDDLGYFLRYILKGDARQFGNMRLE